MEKKGLCNTCVNDKRCVFRGNFPVLQCEEFSDYALNSKVAKHAKCQRTVSTYEATECE